jgi:hypothetical protein
VVEKLLRAVVLQADAGSFDSVRLGPHFAQDDTLRESAFFSVLSRYATDCFLAVVFRRRSRSETRPLSCLPLTIGR